MEEKKFEPGVIVKVKEVLEGTDLVKFAKLTPERELSSQLEGAIHEIVEWTKPKPKEPKPVSHPRASGDPMSSPKSFIGDQVDSRFRGNDKR